MTNNDELALTEDWRDDFEKIFPIPDGMERHPPRKDGGIAGYINKTCLAGLAFGYINYWEGYRAAREALLAERHADKALIAELDARLIEYARISTENANRVAELEQIRAAAEKLVRCKGRYHSEQNYRALAALFGVSTPDLPPLETEARTVSVKWPDDGMDDCYDQWGEEHCRNNFDCGYNFSAVRHEQAIREALAAAGIKLEVGE